MSTLFVWRFFSQRGFVTRARFDPGPDATGAASLGELTRWNGGRMVVADRCSFDVSDLGVDADVVALKCSDSDARRSCIGVGICSAPKTVVSAMGDMSGGNWSRMPTPTLRWLPPSSTLCRRESGTSNELR